MSAFFSRRLQFNFLLIYSANFIHTSSKDTMSKGYQVCPNADVGLGAEKRDLSLT